MPAGEGSHDPARTLHTPYLSSGQHAILSPDIKGFCVVGAPGDSRWDVERQALECLILLQQHDDTLPRGLPAVEAEAA